MRLASEPKERTEREIDYGRPTAKRGTRSDRRLAYVWAVFAALALGIAAAGFTYHLYIKAQLQRGKFDELLAVADIKANVVESWRRERLANASVLSMSPVLARWAEESFRAGAARGLEVPFAAWLESFRKRYEYLRIMIVDTTGLVRFVTPASGINGPPDVRQLLTGAFPAEARLSTQLVGRSGGVRLYALAPIHKGHAAPGGPIGYVVLQIDPKTFLFPFMRRWPTPSATAEAVLVERAGAEVLYLSPGARAEGRPHGGRLALATRNVPATYAVQGLTGTMEGTDYRGRPVLAAYTPVRDSPWGVVAKVDRDETFAPMRNSSAVLALAVAALVVGAAITVLLLSSRQALSSSKERQFALEERDRARAELLAAERRARLAIELSQERIRIATEAAALGTWDWDLDEGRFTWDATAKEILGLPPNAEITYELFVRMLHPEDRERVEREVSLALSHGSDYHLEYRALGTDGETRWVSAQGRVFTDGGGNPTRMVGVVLDVTRRRAFERAVARAQAMEASARAKSEFLALASHELHTPLHGILGYADLLADGVDGPLSPEQRKSVAKIAGIGRKLAALADAMLELSRLQLGEGLSTTEFTLRERVAALAGPYSEKAAEKGLSFFVEIDKGVPDRVRGDPDSLSRALSVLLDNAVKFTDEGSISVSAASQPADGASTVVRFTIRDTGPGIPLDEQRAVFLPFHQVQSPETRSAAGLGLGLALCAGLVEKMGGEISVESQPGAGSVFTLTLPLESSVRRG